MRALLGVLARCGVSFRSVDLASGLLPKGHTLIVCTYDFLARGVQERLVAFVRGGGHLLLFGALPVQDEDLRPCRLLDARAARLIPCAGVPEAGCCLRVQYCVSCPRNSRNSQGRDLRQPRFGCMRVGMSV